MAKSTKQIKINRDPMLCIFQWGIDFLDCPHVQRGETLAMCTLYDKPISEDITKHPHLSTLNECHGKHLVISVEEGKIQ